MPAPYPQWQVSTDNGINYDDISGENSSALTFNTSGADNGNFYRVTYDNACVYQISSAARLTVSTLPVTISSFEVKKELGKAVLQWVTAQEHNSKGFEILYSTNGTDYVDLKWIDGQGNSSLAHTYTYTHNAPTKGINYYRVKQVDVDGKTVLSGIKTLSFRDNNNLAIFPNPVIDEVTIKTAKAGIISITDLTGKEILKRQNIQSELNLNLKSLAPGVYMVKLTTSEGNEVKQLFKH